MADKYLTYDEFLALGDDALRLEFPQLNPGIRGHWATAFVRGLCGAALALQSQVQDLERELFPQDATGSYLDKWGGYEQLSRTPSIKASGTLFQAAPASIVIPYGTKYYAESNDQTYSTTTEVTTNVFTNLITSVTAVGTTVSVLTSTPHNLQVDVPVTIAGVDSTPSGAFDGEFVVSAVIDVQTFQYQKPTPNPGTGTGGTYAASYVLISVEADIQGTNGNLGGGVELTLAKPISGITQPALTVDGGLQGGTEEESTEAWRSRIVQTRSNLEGVFTVEQIRKAALAVAGNTRAYVVTPNDVIQPAEPLPGQVVIYVFRDNDVNPVPSPTLRTKTQEAIIANGKLPAPNSKDDVLVLAQTLVTANFVFSSLEPNTTGMQDAVKEVLKAFFQDNVDFATDVPEISYLAAIQNTQDLVSGDFLKTFSLTSPSGDIVVGSGEIASLGTVTFS